MFVFAPAEPEAQAYRLWWMVGLGKIIARCGKFCLVNFRKASVEGKKWAKGKAKSD